MRELLRALAASETGLAIDEMPEAAGLAYRDACAGLRAAYAAGLALRTPEGRYRLTGAGLRAAEGDIPLPPPPAPEGPPAGPPRRETARARIWAAMQSCGTFCRDDLTAAAARDGDDPVAFGRTVQRVMHDLAAAGYLRPAPGRSRMRAAPNEGQVRYRLIPGAGGDAPRTGARPARPARPSGEQREAGDGAAD